MVIVAAALLAAAVLFIAGRVLRTDANSNLIVTVSIDNEKEYEYPLDEDREFTVKSKYGTNNVIIKEGEVCVTDADCPDRLCVEQGKAGEQGDTIICLPHRMVITVEEK